MTKVNERLGNQENENGDFFLSLILSLGVSFYARLEDRKAYVEKMTRVLKLRPLEFVATIETCQKVFIDEMRLEKTIAKNDALMVSIDTN